MSGLLMGKTYNTTLSTNEKAVLGAYADHANPDGTSIYPGEPYMVVKTSLSKSSVRRITGILKKTGLLRQTKRGHTGQRAEYEIDVALLEHIQIGRPPRGSHPDTHYEMRDQAPKWVPDTAEWVPENAERVSEATGVGTTSSTPNVTEPSEPSEPSLAETIAQNACDLAEYIYTESHLCQVDAWCDKPASHNGSHQNPFWDALVALFGYQPSGNEAGIWGKIAAKARETKDLDAIAIRAALYLITWPQAALTPSALEKHFDWLGSQIAQMSEDDRTALAARIQRQARKDAIAASVEVVSLPRESEEPDESD